MAVCVRNSHWCFARSRTGFLASICALNGWSQAVDEEMRRGIPNWASGGKSCGRGAVGGKVVEGAVVEGAGGGVGGSGAGSMRACVCA